MSPENLFLDELNIFKNEVDLISKYVYTELAIKTIASKDKNILNALNKTPTFWNTVLGGLQNSTFITMGRIFDPDSKKHSIHTLFRIIEGNKTLFTKTEFKKRWVESEDRAKMEDYMETYIKKLYVPSDKEFREFKKFIGEQKKIYEQIYKPIRIHFAHKINSKNEDIKVLFDKVVISELEKFSIILENIHKVFWNLYHNGRGPLLPLKRKKYSTKNILKTKFKPYGSQQANVQYIEEVVEVLKLLEAGSISKNS